MSQTFEQFGKYILLEKLAAGGMAEVFLAKSSGAGGLTKYVAIKRILPHFSHNKEFINMFKDEAKIAINLSHGSIVSIYEFGVEKGQFYLVMDYVQGKNIRQTLKHIQKTKKYFSVPQIIYMGKEIAAALEHAHRCHDRSTGKKLNITHRDMSPQNVMLGFDGSVKVIDFGIAKAEDQLDTTRAGTLKGKFGYMSPEQANGKPVDFRTDIFSLGIVLWELLAKDRLFVANNEINTLKRIRDCQVPDLTKMNPEVSPGLEKIISKALTKDKNFRYQTSLDFSKDLSIYLNQNHPEFSPHDLAGFMKSVYSDEIFDTRKKLVAYSSVTSSDMPDDKTNVLPLSEITQTATHRKVENKFDAPKGFNAQTQTKTKTSAGIIDDKSISKVSRKISTEKLNTRTGSHSSYGSKPYSGTRTGTHAGTQSHYRPAQKPKSNFLLYALLTPILLIGLALGGLKFFPNEVSQFVDVPESVFNLVGVELEGPATPITEEPSVAVQPAEPTPTEEPAPPVIERNVGIVVSSQPSGAEIYIDGESTGKTTPSRVVVNGANPFEISIQKDLYREYKFGRKLASELDSRSFQARLVKLPLGYIDIDVRPSRGVTLEINGKIIENPSLPLLRQPIPANQEVIIKAYSEILNSNQVETVKLGDGDRERITFNFR